MNGAKLYHGRYVACRSGVSTGAALILTLACIVILTALVLLFLTHSLLETQVSVASADQTAASLFARGAVDSVIGELKQEITAGSATPFLPTGSDIRDPNTVFLPTTNQAMVPYRMDAGAPANVLKRSSYNEPFYAGSYFNTSTWPAPQWAVNVSSTNPGTGGRYVSMQRWNEPLLMPTASASSTDLTPTNGFIPPDWVYVTRTAGPATTWNSALIPNTVSGTLNTNCAVGRFAYVVYDEGGLLDANAAGYPSSVSASMVRHKISEACADLTQIGLNTTDINALVTWRNPTNSSSATQYTNYVYSMCTNAFLTPMINGNVTERLFTSRQQLIDFLTQNIAANNPADVERMQAALPYLTTFSRELNAPSWYPQTNMAAGVSGYSYYNNATNSAAYDLATTATASATNIFAPLERSSSAYTNISGLVCNANQPVAFSRFPLSRLSWLTPTGQATVAGITSTQLTADIQSGFGLTWDSANTAWKYAGPSGTTTLASITPLSEIKGREPNFFEILKGAILSGSVNIVPDSQTFPAPNNSTFPNYGGIDTRYSNINANGDQVPVPDQQIMQIGLSMIDQASPALLPTRLEFAASSGSDWSSTLYGNKDLPYLYKMVFSPYRPTAMPTDTDPNTGIAYSQQYFTAWEEPVFWNPYQTVNTNSAPLSLRVRADGTNNGVAGNIAAQTVAQGAGSSSGANLNVSTAPEISCGPAGSGTGPGGSNGASIELDSTAASTFSSLTGTPILLSSLMANGFTPTFNDLRAQSPPIWPTQANADVYTEGGVTYAGFWLGAALARDPPDPVNPVYKFGTTTVVPFSQSLFYSGTSGHRSIQAFVLEANYSTTLSPNFQEIQRLRTQYTSGAAVEEFDNFTVLQRRLNFFTVNDPRTGRFSWDIMQPSDYNPSAPALAPMTSIDLLSPIWTTFMSSTNNAFAGIDVAGQYRGITRCSITSPTTTITPSIAYNGSPGKTPVPYVNTFRWADNTATAPGIDTPAYQDTDGAQRPADGWWNSATANTLSMREDGTQYRPVMLNRNFYSVGELGYVSRDMPWKSLDFSTRGSADAGVLDFFCINDGYAGSTNAPVVAGVVNLNTAKPPVLQAMLSGADRAQLFPTFDVSASDAASMASAITNVTANVPLLNKSEIATRLAPADPTVLINATSEPGIDTNIKERREALVRALASAGQVRTWNLLIDVVAQTGHFPPNATGFNNFLVSAEQRYWAHVAIDRYSGQVVSVQLEPVSE